MNSVIVTVYAQINHDVASGPAVTCKLNMQIYISKIRTNSKNSQVCFLGFLLLNWRQDMRICLLQKIQFFLTTANVLAKIPSIAWGTPAFPCYMITSCTILTSTAGGTG